MIGSGGGDLNGQLVSIQRAWVGRRGLAALRWSFYGTSDAVSAKVKDPDTFPAFALLHYLIRSSGCHSVLECGTGFGVSTACLAAAVAHRPSGRIVTIDTTVLPEREDLWGSLPHQLQQCIHPVCSDSLAYMDRLLSQGDLFDAALLDSLHEATHIIKEFDRAIRLVRSGGLILIHDVLLKTGTVEQALRQIEAQGYGVTRLWTADKLEAEDNGLGLAVIENRRRHK
jgi:predicted O-methyltransferase YrrM